MILSLSFHNLYSNAQLNVVKTSDKVNDNG